MPFADGHLDLAYNACFGRDIRQPAALQDPLGAEIPTVGFPDLRKGDVKLICATIFCEPSFNGSKGYRNWQEANQRALYQMERYQQFESFDEIKIVRKASQLPTRDSTGPIAAIILMEGADPFRDASDVDRWYQLGVRIVGLAWKQTRYAGGTGMPGPLTAEGVELVKALDRAGIIHDASHLAEESFWQLLELTSKPVIASHSNCRAFVPTDRQLSDDMIRALASRGGVIGINYFDKFLLPPAEYGKRRATLDDVVRHLKHICDLTGSHAHVAIGTDMDGGLGQNEIPQEILTSGDLPRVAQSLSDAGFSRDAVDAICFENWHRFFQQHLPK